MKTKLFANPFYCYVLSFGLALLIYSWGWSEIYPTLTADVSIFLISSFMIALYLGKKISYKIEYKKITGSDASKSIIMLIILSYIVEFTYNKGIPIFLLFSGADLAYMDFGIPTFHVILHTFTCFYTVYTFHQYTSTKDNRLLLFVIILLLPNILIVNRGALIMTLTACLIVYLFSIGKVLLSRVVVLLISACIFFYGFGYLGNARSFNGDPYAFLRLTKATDNYTESLIPKEYYWFYIYASSPFANFQNATLTSVKHRYDVGTFITWELLPDFISKRIVPMEADYDGLNRLDYSINPILTVGSIYFEPYIRLGWYGPILVFLFYVTFVYFYIKTFPRHSKYFTSGLAILCVISVFNMFENMINFSGLSFQMLFPFILSRLERYRVRFIGFNVNRVRFPLFAKKIRFKI
ncbi:hypothetical protein ACFSUS_11505 [Spirosoma soli]|uniref:Oligosaccharide repeat unit polymerase n=1 Tax=Spirosoma soli TaxID=1770529 RepID=A0ABW5M3W4_9BACT